MPRLLVPVLHAAAGNHDFVRAHGGVADENELVVPIEGMDDIQQRYPLAVPPAVVLPDRLIDEVVKIVMLEMLELAAYRREQLFTDAHVVVHGPAHVQKQQHLHAVVPFGDHAQIQ